MKKSILFCVMLGLVNLVYSQAPQGIPYQAVARDAQGNPMADQSLTVQFSLHEASADGAVIFQETQSTTTNGQGLFSLTFGAGVPSVGTFSNINWGSGYKFLQVQAEFGNGYVDLGTQQLMSVPYALYAQNTTNSNFETNIFKIGFNQISNSTFTGGLMSSIDFCFNLNEQGYTDWRIPSMDEVLAYTTLNGVNTQLIQFWTVTNINIDRYNSTANTSFFVPFAKFNQGNLTWGDVNGESTISRCVR